MCSIPSGVVVSDNGQCTMQCTTLIQQSPLLQVTFDQYDHEVTCLVMKVVGAYISWIDITYVANEKFSTSVNYCDILSNLVMLLIQFIVEVSTSGAIEGELM